MTTTATPRLIKPYGDTTGDGMVQVSFTLPIPHDATAEGAALQLAHKMGLDPAMVVPPKAMGPQFTFFIAYGRVNHLVDLDAVEVHERAYPLLSPQEVNLAVRSALGRKLVGLALSAREAWQLKLDDGMVIMLGRDQEKAPIGERLERFVSVWPQAKEKVGTQVAVADLRYPSGFALTPVGNFKVAKGKQ